MHLLDAPHTRDNARAIRPISGAEDRAARRALRAPGLCLGSLLLLSACTRDSAPEPTPPVIVEAPTTVAVTAGAAADFSVRAVGSGQLSYQWLRDGVDIAGATAADLHLPAVGVADDGSRFRARVANAIGAALSADAILIVSAAPVAPLLTMPPIDQWVVSGQPAVFAVTATGTAPLDYQWRRDGVIVAGANQSIYTLPAALADDGAQFSVTVSNAVGSLTSITARLRVSATQLPPVIAAGPSAVQAVAGASALFAVTVTGTGPYSYQWKRDGATMDGATAPLLSLDNVQLADHGRLISVRVSNDAGAAESAAALLSVLAAPVAPTITQQPQSASVNPGASITFMAQTDGTAPLQYQWFRGDAPVPGATALSYTVTGATLADDGALFSLQARNPAGSALSFGASLTVTTAPVAPTFALAPASTTVSAGSSAAFYVEANGSAPLSYQWRRNGSPIAAATGALYVLNSVAQGDDGAQFSATVSNAAGSITSPAALLTVALPPMAPTITMQPQSVAAAFGAAVVLQVTATGTGPLAYQWLRNGAAIAGANSASYTIASFGAGDNGARFSVVVSNVGGVAVSSVAVTTAIGVTVTTTSDAADGDTSSIAALTSSPGADGVVSLREAIMAVNNSSGGPYSINFNIVGCGVVCTLSPMSGLPALTAAQATIDGWSQPGWTSAPVIEFDGSNAGAVSGLLLSGTAGVVRGLVVNRFAANGIVLGGAGGHRVHGNYIGLNSAGTAAAGNALHGIVLASSGNIVGGTVADQGNVIAGNVLRGISVESDANSVMGNKIGTSADGTVLLGNGWTAVAMYAASNNTVGGTAPGTGNTIAGSLDGWGVVIYGGGATGNAVLGNRIYANSELGIGLDIDGVTPNDGAKSAGAPNLLIDHPVLTVASVSNGSLTVAGYVGSAPGQSLFGGSRVELFVASDDASGYGEGLFYLGHLTADASGNFAGALGIPGNVILDPGTSLITGTATDAGNNTSEFGPNLIVAP